MSGVPAPRPWPPPLPLLATGAVVLMLAACSSAAPTPVTKTPAVSSSASASPSVTAGATSATPEGPQPLPAAKAVMVRSVTVGSIDLATSKLEKLSLLDDGSLAAPKDPDRAGWYAGGTVPGEVGPAVIAGHVDSTTGPAVFFDLQRVGRGDLVSVELSDGSRSRFRVDRVITTAKKGFPTDAVFGPTPDAELRLITCSGPYDRETGYLDNTIVFATKTSANAD